MKIGAIILAAGASTRMGTSKQMLEIKGENLLTRTINTVAHAGINPIVVVLGAREAEHRSIISNHKVSIVANDRWQMGMGSSIKAGLQYLRSVFSDLEGATIFVCDQPALTSDIISRMVSMFKTTAKPIVASRYSDSVGVPVLFARSYFDKLSQLPDDDGAKKIIMRNPGDVVVIPFPGGEIDLDTMVQYERFLRTIESGTQSPAELS